MNKGAIENTLGFRLSSLTRFTERLSVSGSPITSYARPWINGMFYDKTRYSSVPPGTDVRWHHQVPTTGYNTALLIMGCRSSRRGASFIRQDVVVASAKGPQCRIMVK